MMAVRKGLLNNEPPPANPHELWLHFSDTYFWLRIGLAILGFALPLWLVFWGLWVHGLPVQPSLSAYFFAAISTPDKGVVQCAAFPMRTYFVGGLAAIAAGLFLYKGITNRENTLLNFAAFAALLVAIVPERIDPQELIDDPRIIRLVQDCPAIKVWVDQQSSWPIHWIAVAVLFAFLGLVAWQCACESLKYLPADRKDDAPRFRKIYCVIAICMWSLPVIGFLCVKFWPKVTHFVIVFEWLGIWIFSLYWADKTYELSLSKLEKNPAVAVQNVRGSPPP
jgi:hypothetical protein